MGNFRRAHLGRHFNEGARLLWRCLEKKTLTIEALGRIGGWSRGTAHHWLYGDRRPTIACALVIERHFAIPVTAWGKAPRRPFSLQRAAKVMEAA
jgi:hypothetical protein